MCLRILLFVFLSSICFSQDDKLNFSYDKGEVPFAIIEEPPLFIECKNVEKLDWKSCFMNLMTKHIKENFRYPKELQLKKIEGKVLVSFVINSEGNVVEIEAKGPDERLEFEAYRIISLLPKMVSAKQKGRPVRVPFTIPIIYKL